MGILGVLNKIIVHDYDFLVSAAIQSIKFIKHAKHLFLVS